jgi:hypothetical protein
MGPWRKGENKPNIPERNYYFHSGVIYEATGFNPIQHASLSSKSGSRDRLVH